MYTLLSIVVAAVLFFSLHVAALAQSAATLRAESNETSTRVGNPAGEACGINRVYYGQWNPAYANACDMAGSGCGPTSMAMVLTSFGDPITPNAMDEIFRKRGWRGCGDGSTMVTAITTYLPEMGYTYVAVPIHNGQLDLPKAKEYLDNGYLIIGSTAKHIFVMYDADIANNTVQLMDPARREYEPSVTRPNAAPWLPGEGGWYYAYAVKKEGVVCALPSGTTTATDSVCKGTPVTFATKKLLPRQSDPVCRATATKTCGREDECITPTKIIMHTTILDADADGVQKYFAQGSNGNGVGTQFVIGKDGKTLQMLEMFDTTIEKGVGIAYHNGQTINIELSHTGRYEGRDEVPDAQYVAALKLVRALMKQYNIPKGSVGSGWKAANDMATNSPPGVYGHSQLNPSNKTDPGVGFMRDFLQDL